MSRERIEDILDLVVLFNQRRDPTSPSIVSTTPFCDATPTIITSRSCVRLFRIP